MPLAGGRNAAAAHGTARGPHLQRHYADQQQEPDREPDIHNVLPMAAMRPIKATGSEPKCPPLRPDLAQIGKEVQQKTVAAAPR
jgi:hypothetical protein